MTNLLEPGREVRLFHGRERRETSHDLSIWLPASVRDTVMFETYLNNPREVALIELLTDIHLQMK